MASSLCIRRSCVSTFLIAVVAAALNCTGAAAQGRLDAQYDVTLAGLPIGKGSWTIEIADDQYSATASGGSAGLIQAISSGQGSGGSQGRIVKGQLAPQAYTASVTSNKKTETIRMSLASGNVKDSVIEPEPVVNPERIPVTDAHKRGVIDPMTASMIRVAGSGDILSSDACQGNSAVFDGRMRYELQLAYKRMDRVKADKGYQGPVVVCAIYFTPVAGYIPDRAAIKYLVAQRNMEVWLAPVAGTRVMVPFKVVIPTPLGSGILQARQFVTTAQPRTAASTTRTQ